MGLSFCLHQTWQSGLTRFRKCYTCLEDSPAAENDKYYHFYSVCFGLGCGTALYRPFYSLTVPLVLGVFFTIVFEIVGIISDLPAHTKRCKGPPYDKRDAYWGFCFAFFVAILNLKSFHVYTLSYGCGIVMFALRGAKRKYSSLRKMRRRRGWR